MSYRLHHGDCIAVMAQMAEASIDAIVCDPPYGLEFMGKDWDSFGGDTRQRGDESFSEGDRRHGLVRHGIGGSYGGDSGKSMRAFQAWTESWATEAFRILKPGGHLLAFGGSRTYHRMASGIEDAGFEIRDCLMWLYGSGFPKSLDVSKAIDKAAGAERATDAVEHRPETRIAYGEGAGAVRCLTCGNSRNGTSCKCPLPAPATPESREWQGWGTALKPAHEPIVLARKPLIGTVARNVLEHGTGALNIDGTRIVGEPVTTTRNTALGRMNDDGWTPKPASYQTPPGGRWPANVILGEQAGAMLDAQTGTLTKCGGAKSTTHDAGMFGIGQPGTVYADKGGASRFFYCPKTSKRERNAGLDHLPEQLKPTWSSGEANPGTFQAEGTTKTAQNNHPTVKPVALMAWLCRLVTPPGGVVLDPFLGSGSTGIAALREGFEFVGIEQSADYLTIASARIEHAEASMIEHVAQHQQLSLWEES